MSSTYSNLKFQLMATGENSTTWGNVTNINLGTAIEQAITGSADVAFSGADVTLTLTDTNASQTARNLRLNLTGSATAGYNLIVPSIQKAYIVNNGTDGTITIKNATGTGIDVPTGKTTWVFNDGTNVKDVVTSLTSLSIAGTLTLSTALPVASGGTGVNTKTGTGSVVLNTAPTVSGMLTSTYQDFTSTSAPAYQEGRLWYDTAQKALSYYNDVSNNILTIGQETQIKVINNTGSTIPNGAAVYATSTSSGFSYPNVALAKADAIGTSAVLGLVDGAIANGAVGYVSTQGLITGVNTGSFTVGDVLYLSPYSAGQVMNTVPPTGYAIMIGMVFYSNTPNGTIYVKQTTPLSVSAQTLVGTVAVANGGTGSNTAASARTALGATTVGGNVFTLTNPSAITFPRFNADNTVSALSASSFITAIGAAASGANTDITSLNSTTTINGFTIGYRNIPRSTTTTTATTGDVGKVIAVSAGITIPNATFAAGDAVSIYNDSASAVTITQGASLTLRQAGTANTGNRTLAARGMATVWFNGSSEAIISGAGVT